MQHVVSDVWSILTLGLLNNNTYLLWLLHVENWTFRMTNDHSINFLPTTNRSVHRTYLFSIDLIALRTSSQSLSLAGFFVNAYQFDRSRKSGDNCSDSHSSTSSLVNPSHVTTTAVGDWFAPIARFSHIGEIYLRREKVTRHVSLNLQRVLSTVFGRVWYC